MTSVIAVANSKGGSGKTSAVVNLCYALGLARRRVLLVDLDPQANATVALGCPRAGEERSLAGVLISDNPLGETIIQAPHGLCDLIPSNEDLTAVPVALYNEVSGDLRLRSALRTVAERYDFIVIDCPPDLGILTRNALCAAGSLVVPTCCDFFALDSLGKILTMFEELREVRESEVRLLGILRTMYDRRHEQTQEISAEFERQFGELMFKSVIPYSQRIAESAASGYPVIYYDKSSQGAHAYLEFAGEVLKRLSAPRS